ncbi:hypothetical protein [Bradyrhizobium yuanmingense]|uniref:Uncharacterized protein n=1 Tax=Bradyrhizobium yuanmingense TaxID=108015 RepID=A0ABV4GRM2_9BRAD
MVISIHRDVGEERANWKGIRSRQASIRPPPASMQKIADRLAVVLVLAGLVKGSLHRSGTARRRNGLPAFISASAAARSPSSSGSWRWRERRRPGSPIR